MSKEDLDKKVGAVIDRLLADMEKELPPWRQPWVTTGGGLPVSGVSQRPYRGFNTFVLWAAALTFGWKDNRFFTFAQVRKLKGAVKKGEKGTEVFLWRPAWCLPAPVKGKRWVYAENELPKPTPSGTRKTLLLRTFYVWNADQCEGLPALNLPVVEEATASAEAEGLLTALGKVVPVRMSGITARACYSAVHDVVETPERKLYKSHGDYYSTMFHEMAHASGHKSRLARDLTGTFGSPQYAVEELVAESAAALVMATLNQPYDTQHAAYMKDWAKRLRDLPDAERQRTVMGAFQRGQKAADWVLSGGRMSCSVPDSAPNSAETSTESDEPVAA